MTTWHAFILICLFKKIFYSELLVPFLIFDNQPDTFNVLVPLLLAS